MARFSLTCPPWQGISVLHVHNPTLSKWLRYSLNLKHMRVPQQTVACSPYSVTIFSFARFLPSFFNKLGCTAKITSICGERLQMQMFVYCGKFQMLMCFYCGELQMLMHIYCGGLQIPHGDKPMDFASSSVTSVSLFFKVRQPAR